MFQVLGVRPILGRDFLPSDEEPGAEPVVILRYNVWLHQFGANPAVIGRTVGIDGAPATVIGVMPRGFSFPHPMFQDLWTPMKPPPGALERKTPWGGPYAFARLPDGISIEKARAEMELIGRRLENAYPDMNPGVVPVIRSFDEWFIGGDARTLYKLIWGAVCFVLLMVCANVANLLVERAMGRSHEISLRLALGAGRWRIIRQFLAESLTLAMLGGGLGWWIAKACVRIYVLAQVNEDVLNFAMDRDVAMWLIGISVGAGLLTGIGCAGYLTKLNIHAVIRDDAQGIAGGKRGAGLSGIFVGAEMVLAVILLASAGVIVRSFLNVYTADVGVNTANILAISNPDLQPKRYPTAATWVPYYRNLANRLGAVPGVESVGLGAIPVSDPRPGAYELADDRVVEEQLRPTVGNFPVGTGYFRTLGIRLISGRAFNDSDRASSVPVAIVSQKFAEQHWPGEVPIGKRLRLFRGDSGKEPSPWLTVVGVVSDIVQNDRTRQTLTPLIYVPYLQAPSPFMAVMVKTSVDPRSLIEPIRRQLYAIDPDVPIPVLMLPLRDLLDRSWAFERNVMALLLVFAAVALLLAAVGLYAAVSHSVRRRAQEFGIRVAIGATGRDVVRLVFRQGISPVGTGLAVGLTAAFAVNRVLKSQLVGVSPADPAALLAASVVLVLAAALGCWIPARRATQVDPAIALRRE